VTTFLLLASVLLSRGDLASPKYKVRAAAQARVDRLPLAATPAVRLLANDPDPDVAHWAGQELARRRERELNERAEALMAGLDPKAWPADGNLTGAHLDRLRALTERLYLDPEMATRWAALAHYREGSMPRDGLDDFLTTFSGMPPQGAPEPHPWSGEAVGHWALRTAWEWRARKGLPKTLPIPRAVTPGDR
jgi:hypothetical protein